MGKASNLILKFRAWDKKNKVWAYEGFHLMGEVTIFDLLNQYSLRESLSILEFNQYVNLNDKADNDLYVGDLFKCETNDIIYRIYAVKGGFAINTHVHIWQKDILNDYPFPLIPLSDEQTVSWIKNSCIKVGNIYENFDLFNSLIPHVKIIPNV